MTTIVGPAAAKAALIDLISEIRQSLGAVAGGGAAYGQAVTAAQERLRTFFKATEPADDPDVAAIDAIAFDLFLTLGFDAIAANNARLEAGARRLAELTGQLDDVTAATHHAAASVALRPVKDAIDSMVAIVAEVKALKSNLSSAKPDEALVIAEVDKLAEQFDVLRQAVSGL
jgi:hypothetical protein